MSGRGLSSSEQYTKGSNRKLLFLGLGLLVLFIIALVLLSGREETAPQVPQLDWNSGDFEKAVQNEGEAASFARGNASLEAQPAMVNMEGVVLGSQAEAIVTLTARNAPIEFIGMELAEEQLDGFTLGGTCTPNLKLEQDGSCNIKVIWNPTSLRQLQNILNIRWKEDSPSAFREEVLTLQMKAQSTDSKDCVICESPCKDEAVAEKRMALGLDGKLYEVNDDGTVTINGEKIKVTENGLLINKDGKIVGIVAPDKIPMGLDNKLLGTISPSRDVLAVDGTGLGRLLGDDTIVDSSLKVLGSAIPVVSVMDDKGMIIGKTLPDGTVIDGANTVVGRPLVDGSVVNLEGAVIGFLRPWGLVINFTGDVIGGIVPDGSIVNADGQVVGTIKPTGLAVDPQGELIGGVIPQGVAVGSSCKSLGQILLNGEVKDSFGQVVGKVLLDGAVVDEKQSEIGTAIAQGLVISEKGTLLGFVNSEGKAVDAKGSVIGCVNADGTVSAGSKIIGAVMARGRVIGKGCQVLGSVYPDGSVMNAAVESIGRVMADAYVTNANNRIIGVVIPRGTAIAEGCRLLGLVTLNGQVVDTAGMSVGCVTPEKQVVNRQQEVIGAVAQKGLVVGSDGKVIGRVRLDGKVIDASGKVIGCVNPDGTVTSTDGKTVIGHVVDKVKNGGVILDENGNPTNWTVVGNEVFDAQGNKIGDLQPNGWVTDKDGNIIGVIPPDGVIFSHEGLILGRYSQKTGVAVNLAGERFGVVLPDMTVLNGDKNTIIGALIPDKTSFMDMNGQYLATMTIDGLLTGSAGEVLGAIRADGTVIDRAGKTVGVRIPKGVVLSVVGQELGSVTDKGDVISPAQTKIGRILANGVAVSNDNQVIGGVYPEISLPMGAQGVLGAMTYRGTVNDSKGRQIGVISPFGTVIGNKGDVIGRLVRIGPYTDLSGKLVGWASFKGELNDLTGNGVGSLTMAGVAVDKDGNVMGGLVPHGVVVAVDGAFMGAVSTNGQVIGSSGQAVVTTSASKFVSDGQSGVVGQLLAPGIAVDAEGKFIGWTRYDGAVEDGSQVIGRVTLDGQVVQANGSVIGSYIALGTAAVGDSVSLGVVDGSGAVVDNRGQKQGTLFNNQFVMGNGVIIGRLMSESPAINDNVSGRLIGMAGADGSVMGLLDDKVVGQVMPNGFVSDLTKKVVGGLAPVGLSISTNLNVMGEAIVTGQTVGGGSVTGAALGTGIGAVYNTKGVFSGGIFAPETFIDRNGAIIGRSSGTALIVSGDGKKLAEYVPFGTALTVDSLWAGGALPLGMAINDDGYNIGAVALDGSIIGKDDMLMGRIMSDGTAVGVADKNMFTTMPYAGHLVKQGLPFSYKNVVLGRTTIGGDILDAADKKAYRMLDDGTILGKEMPLDGAVLSFNPATAHDGTVLGSLNGEGKIVSYTGEEAGQIAVNGSVKGNHELKILGALIPEPLVVNDCKVVGQTSFNGQVINGRGDVVGRITPDKWAVDNSDRQIGRVVRMGAVLSPEGNFLGRTLPDSTVVDTKGINMGCARNDGSVVDNAGNVIGHVLERGLVLDKDGNPLGRVKFDGTVVNKEGVAIGKVLGDGRGTVVDFDGNIIGRTVSPDEELMFNADGSIAGTFGRDGLYKSPDGTAQFKVLANGDIIDPVSGRKIATLTEDGRLLDMAGNELDQLRVLRDADGNFIGLINGKGDLINAAGEVIGKVMPDGTIVDLDGNVIGQINSDGTVSLGSDTGCLNAQYNGDVRDSNGNLLYTIKCGKIYDKYGNQIGYIDSKGNMYTNDGTYLGRIDANGNVYDANGDLIGRHTPRDVGNGMGSIGGTDSRLSGLIPGVAMGQKGVSGRRIFIGDKVFEITPKGSLIDQDGTVVGYMGEDGRPYSLDNRLLVGGADAQGRVRPNLDKKIETHPEQLEQMQQLLAQRRQNMRQKIKSFSRLQPDGRTLARAKAKQDLDWGEPKIVSSYPVDMSRMILKDKAIPAVLVHSIDSRYTNIPVTAIVERHIYAEEGRNIIIPAGSRLIGKAASNGGENHVAKLDISWQRLIRPDGSAFKFSAQSGDAQGRGGVAAYLDEQLVQKYGKPVMQTLLDSAVAYATATNDDITTNESDGTKTQSSRSEAASDARSNFLDSMDGIFQQLLQEATSIKPVVFVPAGTRMTVFSNEDLWLRTEVEDEQDYDAQFGGQSKQVQGASKGNWIAGRTGEVLQSADSAGMGAVNGPVGDVIGTGYEDQYYDPNISSAVNVPPIYNGADTLPSAEEVNTPEPVVENPSNNLENRVVQPILPKTEQSSARIF